MSERRSNNRGPKKSDNRFSQGPKKPRDSRSSQGDRPSRGPREEREFRSRGFSEERSPRTERFDRDARPQRGERFDREERRPRTEGFNRSDRAPRGDREDRRPREDRFDRDTRPQRGERFDREERRPRTEGFDRSDRAPRGDREDRRPREDRFDRDARPQRGERFDREERRPRGNKLGATYSDRPFAERKPYSSNQKRFKTFKGKTAEQLDSGPGGVRLNKYLSNAGICSRREADDLIAAGLVEINGKVVTEMGFKVMPTDTVKYGGSLLKNEKKRYLLLNKPKGFLTTMDDPKARKTVMDLVGNACTERIYPVGRLDRATTGVLLFTNDGEMAKKLTHPSHGAMKIYHVVLDKPLAKNDFVAIQDGLTLEDGPAPVDELTYIDEQNRREIGIRIHIGRNRIVRRIFAHLGYEVEKLDRVSFAGLTKKTLTRGQYRFLDQKEINFLMTR